MADTKISALPASTTPLAGTEVLPIVQSSTTRQVSVANLTAGRAISATAVTASTGNFIVGTSGQGIDFSATPGTGTSELLADYEEGTWALTDQSGAGLTFTVSQSYYVKIGNLVTANAYFTFPSTTNTNTISISLPFVALYFDVGMAADDSGVVTAAITTGGAALFSLRNSTLTALTNINESTRQVLVSITYRV
jgi:hypothetical protein